MDCATRRAIRLQRDSAARSRLGLKARTTSVRRHPPGKTSRRWTEAEIRKAVLKATGGDVVRPGAYIELRKNLDPNAYPSYDTVKTRAPDLFL